jgi:hypothetical protein
MKSFFLTLLAPVLVLWIGACVFYVLDRLVPPQDAGVAEALVLCLALGALLWGGILPGEGMSRTGLTLGEAWSGRGRRPGGEGARLHCAQTGRAKDWLRSCW